MSVEKKRRRAVVDEKACVACGCCVKVCPLGAIEVVRGHCGQGGLEQMRRLREVRKGVPRLRHCSPGGGVMKKRWYDYLWIASLAYLILGFFNILFAWLGLLCFLIPLIISIASGTKGYCNRYCDRGQLFALIGGRFGLSRRRDIPQWMKSRAFRYGFPGVLLGDVLPDAVEHLSRLRRGRGPEAGGYAALDLPAPLGLGVSRDAVPPRSGPVRLRLLRRYADVNRFGPHHHGPFQAPQLVRLLPHGDHDSADMPR